MTCQECLALTSDALDGELAVEDRDRVAVHLARCPACARYRRVLDRGLELVRELPDVAPSYDFHDRLQHRLFHVQDEMARRPRLSAPGAALSLAVAGLIAFAAWGPLTDEVIPFADAGTPAMERTGGTVLPDADPPIGGADPWFLGAPPVYRSSYAPSTALAFPGPYSPLIIQPPVPIGSGSQVQFTSLGLE